MSEPKFFVGDVVIVDNDACKYHEMKGRVEEVDGATIVVLIPNIGTITFLEFELELADSQAQGSLF